MAAAPDRRLTDISEKEIERLYNVVLRGLERRLERLGGRSPKSVEPIDNDEPTPNVSN
jgi:hypothetical protein